MNNKHLKLSAHKITHTPTAGRHEEPDGIHVVQKYRLHLGHLLAHSVVIPWQEIMTTLTRKDKQ